MQNFALDAFNILHNFFIIIHNSWNIIIIQLNNHLILDIALVLFWSMILCSGITDKIIDVNQKLVTAIAAETKMIRTQMIITKITSQMIRSKIIINKLTIFLTNNKNVSQSFSLAFILSFLDINIPETASTLTHFSFSIFLLALVSLLCFINVLGFLIAYIFIQNGNYENKYPKLKKIINYYKKSSLVYVTIEALICLFALSSIIVISILYVWAGIK